MTRKILLTLALATAVAASIAITANAHPAPGHGKASRGHGAAPMLRSMMRLERAAARLDLTSEQRQTISDTVAAARDASRPIIRELSENRRRLRELDRNGFDEDAAAALAMAQGDLTGELVLLRTRLRADLRAVLTEEQRELAQERRRARRG